MRVEDLQSIRIKLASPEEILNWSHGEVLKSETINYRTQRAEKDGLFCERIFGPEKDYECYCGKYKRIRYKGVVCDRCGVEVTKSSVRREWMGHIKLATPVSHIWFLKGIPSQIGLVLDISMQQLEKVIYFVGYIIVSVNEDAKKNILEKIENEYKQKVKIEKKENSKKMKSILEDLQAAKEAAKQEVLDLRPLKILSEVEYYNLSLKYGEVFEAGTGAEVLRKIFEKIDLKKEIEKLKKEIEETLQIDKRKNERRLKLFQGMLKSGIRPEWMFLTVLPVLSPNLRPMVQLDGGRYASSDLNDLYRRVINRNNRLKYLLEINAPEVIIRNEKRMLQEAVDALIDNGMRKGTTTRATTGGKRLLKSLADILKGKQGRFRQNLLGKRVDYSGRAVIVVGPELKFYQCGLPKKMALELFKPFVIKRILEQEMAFNVRTATKLIENEDDEVWAILEEIIKNKLVLINRAPTLHRLGIQAVEPCLIEGEIIKIHPMVCKAFNADFDGDQMAVHVPLSDETQNEAKKLMLSSLNLLKPATGTPIVTLYQDISLGCYWLTKIKPGAKGEGKIFNSPEEAILTYEFGQVDLKAKVKIKLKNAAVSANEFIETSVGRIIFNAALPENYPFQNLEIRLKNLENITSELIVQYDNKIVIETLDKIKNLGFEYSTLSGISWGVDDLVIPSEKERIIKEAEKEIESIEQYFIKGFLTNEEKKVKVIEIWMKVKLEIEKLVPKYLPAEGSVYSMVDAGARGSWGQLIQMMGMKGLVVNPSGDIIELPVKASYKEGLPVLEYFIATHGARKGTVDTALRTANAGYLTRRLTEVAHEVIITKEDCGDDKGIEVHRQEAEEIGQKFLYKIIGRVILEDIKGIIKKGELIDWIKAQKIIESDIIKKIRIRSALTCKLTRGICQQCYGWDLGVNRLVKLGEAVGIVAAQAIGEPGTQLTMRTFHTGGVAGKAGDITFGLPRVGEIFEARTPLNKAEISQNKGKILEITPEGNIKIETKTEFSDAKTKKFSKKLSSDSFTGRKKSKKEIIEYQIPADKTILVRPGQVVNKGDQLCEGYFDLKEMFKLKGEEAVQKYIIKEIQKIYVSQGVVIHDKHIESIIRQMFSRVKIKDPGDSLYVSGEVIEKTRLFEENIRLKKEGRALIKHSSLLLGISQVALNSDSFLSAASFQETSRVLIKVSLEGREDRLKGLKENVIIGKLIPIGTEFKKEFY